jgi:hypothetical protein
MTENTRPSSIGNVKVAYHLVLSREVAKERRTGGPTEKRVTGAKARWALNGLTI